jgi:hypothetical protein
MLADNSRSSTFHIQRRKIYVIRCNVSRCEGYGGGSWREGANSNDKSN